MKDSALLYFSRLSTLEAKLKHYYRLREDLHGQILSAEELSAYFQWMAKQPLSSEKSNRLSPLPRVLKNTDIGRWSQQLLNNPADEKAFSLLSENFQTASETHLFPEWQDLSVGQEIRYIPPYWHSHHFFEVYYTFSGSCNLIFPQETLALTPGTVTIIPPQTRKACSCLSDNCVTFCYMLRSSTFSSVFLDLLSSENVMSLFLSHALCRENNTNYLKFDTASDPDIRRLLFSIYEEYHSSHTYRPQMLNALMRTFFLLLLQRFEHTATISEQNAFHWKPEFTSILQYVQEHFSTVTIEQIAKKYHYSPRQVIRIIQNCTGKPFHQLTQQLRMERAALMLRSSECSVKEIASLTGYSSLSSFYRAFLNYYGTAPAAYRKTPDVPVAKISSLARAPI